MEELLEVAIVILGICIYVDGGERWMGNRVLDKGDCSLVLLTRILFINLLSALEMNRYPQVQYSWLL